MDQLTVLTDICGAQITALLAEDAFYNGHLGPKPDAPRIRAEPSSRSKLDYSMPRSGTRSLRASISAKR